MTRIASAILWIVVAGLGAWGYAILALHRGERISSVYILLAALCTYAIAYRFYSKWVAARVLMLDDRRLEERTPEPELGYILRAADQLSGLVNDLLDVTRISTGRLELEREEVDVAALAHRLVARMEDSLAASGSAAANAGSNVINSRSRDGPDLRCIP